MTPHDRARLARLGPAERTAFRGYLLALHHPRAAAARLWQRREGRAPRLLGDRRRVHTLGAPRRRAVDLEQATGGR